MKNGVYNQHAFMSETVTGSAMNGALSAALLRISLMNLGLLITGRGRIG
jgi:hypothetical protein